MNFQPSGSGWHLEDDNAAMLVDHNPGLMPIVTGADASSTAPFSDPRSAPVTQALESEHIESSEPQARECPRRQRRLPA
jgi:hypothetical protein